MSETIEINATPELSDLIDRLPDGGTVVVKRGGKADARLSIIIERKGTGITPEFLTWLDEHRVRPLKPIDSTAVLSEMRDNDWR